MQSKDFELIIPYNKFPSLFSMWIGSRDNIISTNNPQVCLFFPKINNRHQKTKKAHLLFYMLIVSSDNIITTKVKFFFFSKLIPVTKKPQH